MSNGDGDTTSGYLDDDYMDHHHHRGDFDGMGGDHAGFASDKYVPTNLVTFTTTAIFTKTTLHYNYNRLHSPLQYTTHYL